MARIGLRFVIVAAVLAMLLIGIVAVLTALTPPHQQLVRQPDLAKLAEVQAASAPILLNANGVGTQVISGTALTLKLEPFPVLPNQPATITLVALSIQSRTLAVISPTLGVAAEGSTDLFSHPMARRADGAYVATGVLFPRVGLWRARIVFSLDDTPDFVTLLSINIR